jgi:hypothetical protein
VLRLCVALFDPSVGEDGSRHRHLSSNNNTLTMPADPVETSR